MLVFKMLGCVGCWWFRWKGLVTLRGYLKLLRFSTNLFPTTGWEAPLGKAGLSLIFLGKVRTSPSVV
jgi:hypothetical protein